jgi:uncharacterized protein YjbJ (UPF0337 family)
MAKNSRARGRKQALAGKVKKSVGRLIGNEDLVAAGTRQVIEGEAAEAKAKASERAIGAAHELSGKLKHAIGDRIHSRELSDEGQAEIKQGKALQSANQ